MNGTFTNRKTGQKQRKTGQSNGTPSRARTLPLGEMSRLSHGTQAGGQVGHKAGWDRTDRPEGRPSRPPGKVVESQPKTSWMHIGAMNLLADHDAGIHVEPAKLELARRILGRTS